MAHPEPFTRSDHAVLRRIRSRLHPSERGVFDRAVRYGRPCRLLDMIVVGWLAFIAGAIAALSGYWGSALL